MGSIDQIFGVFRYVEADLSTKAEDRAIYAPPAPRRIKEETLVLHNFWTSDDVAKGNEGLDVQSFTYINHTSALSSDEFFEGTNCEDVYAPECIDLILKLTGAKRGIAHNVAFRRDLATNQADLSFVPARGGAMDQAIAKLPKDRLLVTGREGKGPNEPARQAHVDMTLEGFRRTFRYARRDITAAAQHIIEAEGLKAAGHDVKVPRYASYSVWRPLKTVKRDPIAVLDWRSVDKSKDIQKTENRIPSEVNASGDYIIEALTAVPPEHPEQHRWYWVPEQKPDEVLIIKFADSAAEHNKDIAEFCLHVSPKMPGTEDEECRQSVECRVYAFWE
ncbi:hypothetical protein AC579_2700 [Pseudocercospora musae]|uniref:GA4 desaturase n=1 Tax=Pseudocercospora musae TaxID=113226 RepID=A0A139IVF2_9PEZI|nr:hypothetical protein AC579_2700 [Pseudocercospora musae]